MNKLASIKTGVSQFVNRKSSVIIRQFLVAVVAFFFLQNAFAQPTEKPLEIPDSLKKIPFGIIFEVPVKARYVCADVNLNSYVITEKNEILSFGV